MCGIRRHKKDTTGSWNAYVCDDPTCGWRKSRRVVTIRIPDCVNAPPVAPENTNDKSANTNDKPETSNDKPEDTNDGPGETGDKSENTDAKSKSESSDSVVEVKQEKP